MYPLHSLSVRPIFAVILLQDPKEVLDSCEIIHVKLETNLFHKLKLKNECIYTTVSENIFITCNNDKQAEHHLLGEVGILFLNKICKAYGTRNILIPHQLKTTEELINLLF